ncbi:MAG: D-alanine--D-alanine ligase [Candidatus Omnitrophica bacterium]|nr:D-alanine--D-alanine ligase [Candidatus Omnitrophota bacterium]
MSPDKEFGRVGVLMGGNSSERPVSLRSGGAVLAALEQKTIHAIPLDLEGPLSQIQAKMDAARLDLAFIALHGRGGEDGMIQNLLEEMGIAYIGSDAQASYRAFNKLEAKNIFREEGIPTPDYAVLHKDNAEERLEAFSFPLFIKPLEEGSSIGVIKIDSREQMETMGPLQVLEYGSVLVETAILGREFTVGILGEKPLPIIELKPQCEFYDYTAKYTKGMTQYLVPAPVSAPLASRIQEIALNAHRVLGLRDFSRVDIMLDTEERPFVLEANTIPGFTETSLLPKAAKEAGIQFADLCVTLLTYAKERALVYAKKK